MSSRSVSSAMFIFNEWKTQGSNSHVKVEETTEPDLQLVCLGKDKQCKLEYSQSTKTYKTHGKCIRQTFCTELRILKDMASRKEGTNDVIPRILPVFREM